MTLKIKNMNKWDSLYDPDQISFFAKLEEKAIKWYFTESFKKVILSVSHLKKGKIFEPSCGSDTTCAKFAKEGHQIVHISRFGKNSKSEDANMLEKFGNNMFTFLVNTFFGGHLTDALNGFRLIKKNIMIDLNTDAQYLNIEQQICIRCAKKKYPIYEIESDEPKRIGGQRKMRPLIVGAQLSWQIVKEFIFWKV